MDTGKASLMENNETNTTKTENTHAKIGDTFEIEGIKYKIALVEIVPEETSLNRKIKKQRTGES